MATTELQRHVADLAARVTALCGAPAIVTHDVLADRFTISVRDKRRAVALGQEFSYADVVHRLASPPPRRSRGFDRSVGWTPRKSRRERIKANAERRRTRGPRVQPGLIPSRILKSSAQVAAEYADDAAEAFARMFKAKLAEACVCGTPIAPSRHFTPSFASGSGSEFVTAEFRTYTCPVHGRMVG
jgi:hypothetical protein